VGAFFIEPEWYAPLRATLTEPLRSAFTLAYHRGIRVHEMRRLRWRNVNLQKRMVTLPASITKTKEPREFTLPNDFDLKPGKDDVLVFSLPDIRDEWHEACVKIGAAHYTCRACGARCDGRQCPTHAQRRLRDLRYVGPLLRHCRHTAVRTMDEAGVTLARIKEITGHQTDSMVHRYNIGRAFDVKETGEAIERHHQEQQAALRERFRKVRRIS
jgi:integrase